MKRLIKKLRKLNTSIRNKMSEIRQVDELQYYVNHPEKKQPDLFEMQTDLKELLSKKYATLESLEIYINADKADVSCMERRATLEINKYPQYAI